MKKRKKGHGSGFSPLPKVTRKMRVLVHVVTEKPRPSIQLTGYFEICRPRDFTHFGGFEEWLKEADRRKAIDRLLTPGEKVFFDKYCCLRDD